MKRTLLVLIIFGLGLIATIYDAYYGLLLYSWFAFASPLELTHGILSDTRLSFIVGVGTLAVCFIQRRRIFIPSLTTFFLALFVLVAMFSLAVKGVYSLAYIINEVELLTKLVMMTIVAPVLVTRLSRLRLWLIVIAASTGVLGAYYGAFGLLAGSRSIIGPGRIGDNNTYAVWLITSLPLIFFTVKHLPSFKLRNFGYIVLLGNLVAVLLTFSRAGLIGLLVVLIGLLLQMKRKIFLVFFLIVALPFGGLLGYSLLSSDTGRPVQFDSALGKKDRVEQTIDSYLTRIQTLNRFRNEASVESRLHFWRVAIDMLQDNPLLGVGFGNYLNRFDDYDTTQGLYGSNRAAHSTPLLVAAELGFAGIVVSLVIIFSTLALLSRAKALALQLSDSERAAELIDYVKMVQISALGFAVGSLFVVCLHIEMMWVLVALAMVIERVARGSLEREQGGGAGEQNDEKGSQPA